MILSILICTLEERREQFNSLVDNLTNQVIRLGVENDVLIHVDHTGREWSTGMKRNSLMSKADSTYSVFIDDDDKVPDYYVEEILKAAKYDCDCMAINGIMTTNGVNEKKWFISLGMPYKADWSTDEEIYLRYPNHITPIKTEIAKKFQFADITRGEDYDWATRIHNSGILKTQAIITKPMYHYKFIQL